MTITLVPATSKQGQQLELPENTRHVRVRLSNTTIEFSTGTKTNRLVLDGDYLLDLRVSVLDVTPDRKQQLIDAMKLLTGARTKLDQILNA